MRFPAQADVRPTPDRVRETVFNWLANAIPGARCLDLFTGSGALGLEALSRGASTVDFVDSARPVIQQLQQTIQQFKAKGAQAVCSTAQAWLQQASLQQTPYDIIFIDPPFHQSDIEVYLNAIEQQQCLKAKGWIYLETKKDTITPSLPKNWHWHKEKSAGQVTSRLLQKIG